MLIGIGLGMYAKQGDAVRTGKKTYMTCCERDVMEEQWIYESMSTSILHFEK